MSARPALARVREEMRRELTARILPYWDTVAVDEWNGGVVGWIGPGGQRMLGAPKGGVLHARVLWAFSAAARAFDAPAHRARAETLARYFAERFLDAEHGGAFWMLSADGGPSDDRKHVYAQAFAIYALAEHAQAGGEGSLARAIELFRLVERRAHDDRFDGYEEAFTRDWTRLDDARLSPEDPDERKSTNTHLHVLEAYAGLFRAWPGADPLLARRLRELVVLFLDRIVDEASGTARPCFDADWTPTSRVVSFGHDIETAWLLLDAAETLGDAPLVDRARETAVAMADAVLRDGFDDVRGGVFTERRADGTVNTFKDWWPQAEGIVGFLVAHQLTGRADFANAVVRTWDFVQAYVIDHGVGEWRWRVTREGAPHAGLDVVGPWKCPYHTARACLEVLRRVPP